MLTPTFPLFLRTSFDFFSSRNHTTFLCRRWPSDVHSTNSGVHPGFKIVSSSSQKRPVNHASARIVDSSIFGNFQAGELSFK